MRRCRSHRAALGLLVAGLLCAAVLTPLQAEGPEGAWKLRMSYGGRSGRVSILKLSKNGDRLRGMVIDHQGPRTQLENLTYEDGKLSFEISSARRGQTSTTRYEGVLAEGKITGTAQRERRGRDSTVDWVATRTSEQEISRDIELPPVAADIGLSEENYQTWRDHILPNPDEMAWEKIPWLTTFKDGVLAADAANKPLLLWTMNGHPLGCT